MYIAIFFRVGYACSHNSKFAEHRAKIHKLLYLKFKSLPWHDLISYRVYANKQHKNIPFFEAVSGKISFVL